MNKALHALVYLVLAASAAALYFEINLYEKKELLKDRNRQLEDTLVTLSKTIEKADPAKPATAEEARQDVDKIEAKPVDNPETKNLLDGYLQELEEQNLETLNWRDNAERLQTRVYYKLDDQGNKIPDVANDGKFVTTGAGTAQELFDKLILRAKAQQTALNNTRAELVKVRKDLQELVTAYNKLPPEMRQDKITIEQKKKEIADLEAKKTELEENISKLKTQIEDLNSEIKSLKDELQTAKDETEAVKEDLAKKEKVVEQLKKLLQDAASKLRGGEGQTADGTRVTSGDKGKIVKFDRARMFAVIEFSDDAIKELLGDDRNGALPQMEMGVMRVRKTNDAGDCVGDDGKIVYKWDAKKKQYCEYKYEKNAKGEPEGKVGNPVKDLVLAKFYKGHAGQFIGRVRLRQAVANTNLVVADVLGDWLQERVDTGSDANGTKKDFHYPHVGDVVFSE